MMTVCRCNDSWKRGPGRRLPKKKVMISAVNIAYPPRSIRSAFLAILLLFLLPSSAGAFVPHSFAEVYIHQMGHIYFLLSCLFIIWVIRHHGLQDKRGWRYIFLSEVFFILWNGDTFIGHITEFRIDPSQITGGTLGWDYFFRHISLRGWEALYYVTRYDHLLCVPAMYFFVAGLRELLEEEGKSQTAALLLPLFPLMLTDMAGGFVMIILSLLCLYIAVKLYNTNRENTMWNYLLWLSVTHFVFSFSRSAGHIAQRILTPAGYANIWKDLEPYSGSLNTFTFIVIGSVSFFFFRAYETYLKMSDDKKKIEGINAALTELNQELETMVAERTMSLMALTVADRVRNPAVVIGWTCKKILEEDGKPEKIREGLNDVLGESRKLESIVRDFETLLKSKQSMFRYEDLNEIVRGLVALVEKGTREKGIGFETHLSRDPLKINSQKNLLRAAIYHLVRNSIEATPEGGTITVTTAAEGDNVILSVSDTGYGIPQEDVAKIFDPFYSTKRLRYGMGLPLVKQIISEHLGEIKVESTPGKGTTVEIVFPVRWNGKR
jgi:signal transduction histidine kinase